MHRLRKTFPCEPREVKHGYKAEEGAVGFLAGPTSSPRPSEDSTGCHEARARERRGGEIETESIARTHKDENRSGDIREHHRPKLLTKEMVTHLRCNGSNVHGRSDGIAARG